MWQPDEQLEASTWPHLMNLRISSRCTMSLQCGGDAQETTWRDDVVQHTVVYKDRKTQDSLGFSGGSYKTFTEETVYNQESPAFLLSLCLNWNKCHRSFSKSNSFAPCNKCATLCLNFTLLLTNKDFTHYDERAWEFVLHQDTVGKV